MRKPTRIVLASLTAAVIAVNAMSITAVAAEPRVAILNGIPGRSIDVCLGDNEIRSNLKYGRWFQRTVSRGARVLRFMKAAPGTCSGSELSRRALLFETDSDATIVATAKSPRRILVFDNETLGTLGPSDAQIWYAWRYAGDLGEVALKAGFADNALTPFPAADPVWSKGGQTYGQFFGDKTFTLAATRPDSQRPLVAITSVLGGTEGEFRDEYYLIGTKVSNARFVEIRRRLAPV